MIHGQYNVKLKSVLHSGSQSLLTDTDVYRHSVLMSNWAAKRRSWLRHCGTSRKVAGSIYDGANETFL